VSLSGINKQIHLGAKWIWEDSTKVDGFEVADYIGVCTCLCLQILYKAHLVVFCPCLTPKQQSPNFITPSQIILFLRIFFPCMSVLSSQTSQCHVFKLLHLKDNSYLGCDAV